MGTVHLLTIVMKAKLFLMPLTQLYQTDYLVIKSQGKKRHKGSLNEYCSLKEVNLKILYTVQFQPYYILEKAKI